MEHEAGDASGARAWSDRALREAREAGDSLTEVFALVQRAELVDAAEPGEIVAAAVAARERTGAPPGVGTLARRHEARAYALAGEAELCHRCLEECLEECLEARPEGRLGDHSGERGLAEGLEGLMGEPDQTRAELCAGCLVDLGRPGGAVEMLEGEPDQVAPVYLAAYALARRAHAYAEAHERDRAADLARRALVLARRAGAARALRELSRVHLPRTRQTRAYAFV